MTLTRRFGFYRGKFDFMNNAYKLDVLHYKKLMVYKQEVELFEQWVKVDFIANAIETLLQCRRTIMYSYAFIYYMTTIGNEIFLLEEAIEAVYKCTENLAFLIENKINSNNVYEVKSEAISKTSMCMTRRKIFLQYIKEGWEKKWWRPFPIPPVELLGGIVQDDDLLRR
jgi:ariadne-1